MTGLLGDIIQETLQPTKSLGRVTIGLRFSKMHTHMSGNVMFSKGVEGDNLKPVMITGPFEQWGMDIIGEIKPNSSLQHKYIWTATDYSLAGSRLSHCAR